jgi:hypothetical protein
VYKAIGGYYVVEADDLDAAIELASRIPAAHLARRGEHPGEAVNQDWASPGRPVACCVQQRRLRRHTPGSPPTQVEQPLGQVPQHLQVGAGEDSAEASTKSLLTSPRASRAARRLTTRRGGPLRLAAP